MLAKVVSKRRLIYYNDKSVNPVYLFMLTVLPHKAQVLQLKTDLRDLSPKGVDEPQNIFKSLTL